MSYDVEALRRREFPWAAAGETIFLNNASTGPLPERTIRVTEEWAQLRANPQRVDADLQFGTLAKSRELIARLVGAQTGEIAVATNTTYGLNLAAFSLPLKEGDVVLSPDFEFPANVYPWMALAERRGVEYRQIVCDEGVLDPARLLRELEDERIRAVTVSWVQFASGARVDLDALGSICRERGVFFVVDAIQGVGPLVLDLSTTHVDILACGAQKWLLSPWGSGFVYVRKALIETLEPYDVSWLAVRNADDFSRLVDYDFTWRSDARKYEFVTLPYQDMAGMNASLELIHELGADAVSEHALSLAQVIVDWTCDRDDVDLVTPRDAPRRAAVISVRPRDPRAAS
ncbi:MAG TPA: aminotransferase class V-fold PLP-dependent enzyme, partial [Gemmatimonadaceae bacterium]